MTLPFDLREELTKLRRLELEALKADNAVLRQRCKIFPPLEAEVGKALSVMDKIKDRAISEAIKTHGSKGAAAEALGIGRATIYKRLKAANGQVVQLASLVVFVLLLLLAGCSTLGVMPPAPRLAPVRQPSSGVSAQGNVSAQAEIPPATATVMLAWDPSPDATATGYNLYHGNLSRTYTNSVNVGTNTTATLPNLIQSSTYYFAATAYNALGTESVFSDELAYTIPVGARYVIITFAAPEPSGPWLAFRTNTVMTTNLIGFFRQQIMKQ